MKVSVFLLLQLICTSFVNSTLHKQQQVVDENFAQAIHTLPTYLVQNIVSGSPARVAPILHALAAFPAIRKTFESPVTAAWFLDTIGETTVESVDMTMDKINDDILKIMRLAKQRGPVDGEQATSLGSEASKKTCDIQLCDFVNAASIANEQVTALRERQCELNEKLNVIYCANLCEYVKSIKTEYSPQFDITSARPFTQSARNSGRTVHPSGHPEIMSRVMTMLAHAEPFDKVVAAYTNQDIVICRINDCGMCANPDHVLLALLSGSEIYIRNDDDTYTYVPENENLLTTVSETSLNMSSMESAMYVRRSAKYLFDEIPLYSAEKKKIHFLRTVDALLM
jgi:hypothetical protein